MNVEGGGDDDYWRKDGKRVDGHQHEGDDQTAPVTGRPKNPRHAGKMLKY